jgi:hypothetical protein
MEYFLLGNTTDEKIVGKQYPQCKGMPSGLGLTSKWFEQANSMTNLNNNEFPNFEPELIFELDEKAKLTDVVTPSNISAKGLLVNDKLKNILDSFNLIEHRYYPAILIVNGEKRHYYWLHFKESNDVFLNYIDFEKSSFYIGNLARWKEATIDINTIDEYYQIKKSIGFKTINFEQLYFKENFKQNPIELFYIDNLHNDFIINDVLKNTLQTLGIKGFEVYKAKFSIS